ncbi:hypothetical protein NHJ6243_000787 [Beauveria neobassiana]
MAYQHSIGQELAESDEADKILAAHLAHVRDPWPINDGTLQNLKEDEMSSIDNKAVN